MQDDATQSTAAQSADGVFAQAWSALIESYGAAAPFYILAGIGLIMMVIALPIALRKHKDPLDRFSFSDGELEGDLARLREDGDDGKLKGLAGILEPTDQEEMSETRALLRSAGYKGASAVRQFYFARATLALGLGAVALVMTLLIPREPDLMFGGIISGVLTLAGYFLPSYWVRRKIETRKEDITNAFPDAMDMMLVCVEGGQSLDQAMTRVGEEMQASSGPLAEEFLLVSHEFRAGKDRIAVLRDFAARCAVSDISSFVTVLIQSTSFGTSISQALRVYASEMRDKRLMRAEEKANVLPTKLTLGTMMFTVPPLILILVGPSFIMILRSLGGLGSGGPVP
jgi:tight adherence protein C